MVLIESVVSFIVSLLIGGLGIYIGAMVVAEKKNYGYAVMTALFGAIVWVIAGFLFGWLPFVGPLITLLAWVGFIKWRYSTGWIRGALIGLIAWVSSILVMFLLTFGNVSVLGIPGV